MKTVSYALAILFATCAPISAQTGPTGTWRLEGAEPPFPWEVVLRVDGPRLTGMVNSCTSYPVDIFEGRIEGNTVTFKCKSGIGGERDRTITFTGRINGDEIAFTWDMKIRDGGWPPNISNSRIFSPSGPRQFIAKRVPDAKLAEQNDKAVRGAELAAAVNLLEKDLKVDGMLFLPQKVSRVRAVIVAPYWGLGQPFYEDPQVRRLLETTQSGVLLARFSNIGPSAVQASDLFSVGGAADGLLLLLQRLAEESGHPELSDAPLLFWGHSAGGSFGPTFGEAHPQRTIAFVFYHSAGGGGEMAPGTRPLRPILNQIPALVFNCCQGTTPTDPTGDFWRSGRSAGAPWTVAFEPHATHMNAKDLPPANDLLVPWITAVLRQRLSPGGGTLRVVTDASSWMGNNQTGEVAPSGTFPGSKADASWLPDEPSARGWQIVWGAAK